MVATNSRAYNITCDHCGAEHIVMADQDDVFAWLAGEKYIQDALGYLSAADRELLISRTCDKCWKHMYPEVDTEEQYGKIK